MIRNIDIIDLNQYLLLLKVTVKIIFDFHHNI